MALTREFKRILFALSGLVILTYAADDISIRYKIPASRQVFGTVQVRKVYAVKRKNGSTEFLFDDPVMMTCVNSLLPHMSVSPCWYLERHPEQREDICDGCDPIGLTK